MLCYRVLRGRCIFSKRIKNKFGARKISPIMFFWLLDRLLDKEKHGLDVAALRHRGKGNSFAADVKQLFRTGKQAST
jgi:hypothetical protein